MESIKISLLASKHIRNSSNNSSFKNKNNNSYKQKSGLQEFYPPKISLVCSLKSMQGQVTKAQLHQKGPWKFNKKRCQLLLESDSQLQRLNQGLRRANEEWIILACKTQLNNIIIR